MNYILYKNKIYIDYQLSFHNIKYINGKEITRKRHIRTNNKHLQNKNIKLNNKYINIL